MASWIIIGVILAVAIACCVGIILVTRPEKRLPPAEAAAELPTPEPTPAEAVDELLEAEAAAEVAPRES